VGALTPARARSSAGDHVYLSHEALLDLKEYSLFPSRSLLHIAIRGNALVLAPLIPLFNFVDQPEASHFERA